MAVVSLQMLAAREVIRLKRWQTTLVDSPVDSVAVSLGFDMTRVSNIGGALYADSLPKWKNSGNMLVEWLQKVYAAEAARERRLLGMP